MSPLASGPRRIRAKREATDQLRRYSAKRKDEGVPITRIADAAHLSRQSVYDLLAEPPSA